MVDLLIGLSEWTVGFADSDWAALVLALNSLTESVFFPIPPDPLLIGIGIRQPEMALWLAALATISSVVGAIAGHWIGRRFGRPLLYRLVSPKKIETVERMFRRYGAWAILAAAATPIPYKVFTISAGILDLDKRTFILASLVGRGARFFVIGALLFAFGESIEEFINTRFEMLTIAGAVALAVGLVVVAIVARRRRPRDAIG